MIQWILKRLGYVKAPKPSDTKKFFVSFDFGALKYHNSQERAWLPGMITVDVKEGLSNGEQIQQLRDWIEKNIPQITGIDGAVVIKNFIELKAACK
jgi:carbamoylphosphate synthase small subunit